MVRYTKDGKTEQKTVQEIVTILKRYCAIRKIKKKQERMGRLTKFWN